MREKAATPVESAAVAVARYDTTQGAGWIASDARGDVVALGLPGTDPPGPAGDPGASIRALGDALAAYWSGGPLPAADPRFIARAATTPFLKRVYEVVAAIPAGRTMTYGAVAAAAGRPGAARAVGAAMARNPFAPVIPCHRVVGSDGSLTGYGGGLDMKRRLLEMERADA